MVTVPSPQSVGREFVRQYYTLLNKEPVQIHRFYTKQSWFLHGRAENGPTESPVIGQEAIYNKIKELNFHDCHTKIRQVDSHSTVGGGVVVQVSGELSNDAKPMRRFMQTFVLAPGEGPGKYYVHNDIFHYQDEVFSEETSDETADGTVDSEGEEDIAQQVPVVSNVGNHEQPHQEQELAHDIANDKLYYADQGQTNGSGLANQEHLMQDGDEEDESQELQEVVIDKQLEIQHHEPSKEPTLPHSLDEEKQLPLTSDVRQGQTPYEEEEQGEDEEPEGAGSEPEGAAEEVSEDPADAVQEKPKTWAALAASGAPPSHTITSSVTNSRPPPPRQTQQSPSQPASQQAPRSQATPARPNREVRSGLGSREARITARNAPDNHQVFIGNLPNGVKDDDVRNVFSQYGTILEIRLNPKKLVLRRWGIETQEIGIIKRIDKNFGFVIFNSAEPVEQILNSRPIKIGNHEINIEEKKPSGSVGRGGVGNRRGGGGRGNNRGGGSGGSQVGRGGSGGPRASNRGGFGPSGGGGNSGPGSNTRGGRRDSGGRGGKKQ